MKQMCVMIAEGIAALREDWSARLLQSGYQVIARASFQESTDLRQIGVFIAGSGCDRKALDRLRQQGIPVIFIAHASSEQLAIDALRAGCAEYLKMPVSIAELQAAIERFAVEPQHLCDDGMVGNSAAMQSLRGQVARLAKVRSSVLIIGETGTGKELVAQSIHSQSDRASRRLVSVNCAAIPDSLAESELFGHERGSFTGAVASQMGKLQAAEAGTIFLDEVGDMSPTVQAKLLRVLEARELYRLGSHTAIPVNVRVVAATHRNLEEMTAGGRFRSDLLYRLSVARLQLPPLRERREDIKPIAIHCMGELNRELKTRVEGLSEELWNRLINYSWPGNIRELRNMLEAMFVHSSSRLIAIEDLPPDLRAKLGENCLQDERDRLLAALSATKWNKSKAAEKLQWSRMTLYRKMSKYSVHHSSH